LEGETEGLFSSLLKRILGTKHDLPIEKLILSAQEEGDLRPEEVAMLLNVIRLSRRQVREIMVPRTDIICAEIEEPLDEVAKLIIAHGHSRIPIYRVNRDNIVGIVHAKDLLRIRFDENGRKPVSAADIVRTPLFIPETKAVSEMLQDFRSRKIHLAIALDEYGGTSGMVTFEDVLEEIVGEIEDEYDQPGPEDIQVLDNRTVLVSGRTPLDELDEELDIELDSEQVETLSGYLCELAGRVPAQGETFTVSTHDFTVKEADEKQVHWVLIKPSESAEQRV
jgi:magnesium and cobalt transporter